MPPKSMLHTRRQDERQSARRLTCEVVTCDQAQGPCEGRLIDISATGAFIEADAAPTAGTRVNLSFSLPYQSKGIRLRFGIIGLVVRKMEEPTGYLGPQGFCVHFTGISEKERAYLSYFTENASA